MVYDINPFVFREKYIVPVSKKYRNFFAIKLKNEVELLFFKLSEGRFILRPPIGRLGKNGRIVSKGKMDLTAYLTRQDVPFTRVTLEAESEFSTLWRICRRIVENPRKSLGRDGLKDRRNDLGFFRYLIKRFGGKSEIIVTTIEDSWIAQIDGNTVPFDDEIFQNFRKSRMFEFVNEEGVFLREFVRKEKERYTRVSSSLEDLI